MPASENIHYPPLMHRLYSVWNRHVRVYTTHLLSNAFPPFVEPLIFLAGIGLGLGKYITEDIGGLPYIKYLAVGLPVTSAMWTATFECTYGTLFRLDYQKVYDGMLAAPITANNLVVGEILWAGTKGFFFTLAVLLVLLLFGVVPMPNMLIAPVIGFMTAVMMACLSLYVTSYVKTINHFTFFFTGFVSPMMFFSGVVFPVENLPDRIEPMVYILPLTHSVRLIRAFSVARFDWTLLLSLLYVVVSTFVFGMLAIRRLRKRLIR